MSETETVDGQSWPPSPATPEGRAQIRICALDMAIRCRCDSGEDAADIVSRAKTFAAFLSAEA